MSRFLNFFFVISFLFLNVGTAKSDTLNLAYVDVDIIINDSKIGKKFFGDLNKSIQKKKKNFLK